MTQTDPPALRQELACLLAAPSFDASDRNRRFLTYIVEETLAGRADRIKAYCIATEVFGRPSDFDPQIDPIVRIEAGRLRRSLERHYLLCGQTSGRLTIPRGGYIPQIESADQATPDSAHDAAHDGAAIHPPTPRLLLDTVASPGDDPAATAFAQGLTRDLTVDLGRFPNLSVHVARPMAGAPVQGDYCLSGCVEPDGARITVEFTLTRLSDARTIWADRIDRDFPASDAVRIRHEIATHVARTVAQAYGVIFADCSPEPAAASPGTPETRQAVLDFLHYLRRLDVGRIEDHAAALERAVRADPASAEAHACLAVILSDEVRYHRIEGPEAEARQHRALGHARQAVNLAPQGAWGYFALGIVTWFLRDVEGAFSALEQALELNPNEPLILAELGLRHALRMQWDKAVPMLRTAYALTGALPPSYNVGLYLYLHHIGDYEAARHMALRFSDVPVVYGPLCLGLAAIRLNRLDEASAALDRLHSILPGYLNRVRADLLNRNLHPDLVDGIMQDVALLQSLRDARHGTRRVVTGKF